MIHLYGDFFGRNSFGWYRGLISGASRFMMAEKQSPVLFFDDVCGLCHHFVQFLLLIDKRRVFKVAPLQGLTAARMIPSHLRENLTSLVVRTRDGRNLIKSRAVMEVFREIGGPWSAVYYLLRWIPPALLDPLYNFIAAHRYRLFGKRELCFLPKNEDRERFLD